MLKKSAKSSKDDSGFLFIEDSNNTFRLQWNLMVSSIELLKIVTQNSLSKFRALCTC